MQDERELRRLAGIDTRPSPTLSLYLALDQPRDARLASLSQMVKDQEARILNNGGGSQWEDVRPDLDRAVRYVEELPLGPQRGLALFACSGQEIFETHTFKAPLPNLLKVGPTPYLRPLAALAGDYIPTLAVVMDSRRARILESFLGELREVESLATDRDEVATEKDGELARAGDSRQARREEEAAHRHYKELAARLLALSQDGGHRQLLLGGSRSAVEAFRDHLHPYLVQRLGGTFACDPDCAINTAAAAIQGLQATAHRQRQEKLLADLQEGMGPGGQVATGLNQVLAALHEGKVRTLFVRRGYTADGGSCPSCGRLRHTAGVCPICNQEMTPVEDVVNLALLQALSSGAVLEQIDGDSDLDGLGSIAARLRYA